jgi:hypothetical protein
MKSSQTQKRFSPFYEIHTWPNGHEWVRYWCSDCFDARGLPTQTSLTEIVRGPISGPHDAMCVICKKRAE